jgi:hypothetical protein
MRRFLTIIIILLLVVTGVWYFYVRPREMGVAAVPSILKPFFPTSTTNKYQQFTLQANNRAAGCWLRHFFSFKHADHSGRRSKIKANHTNSR